jgi:hypothetical protein
MIGAGCARTSTYTGPNLTVDLLSVDACFEQNKENGLIERDNSLPISSFLA